MTIEEISKDLIHLSDKISYIDETVKFHIGIFWTVIGIILTVFIAVAYIMINKWVTEQVEKRLKEELDGRFGKYQKIPEKFSPPLIMGWIPDGVFEVWKDESGYVYINGVVKGGIIGETFLTFPISYRPYTELRFPVTATDRNGICTVKEDGKVFVTGCNNTLINLSGISFKAKQ